MCFDTVAKKENPVANVVFGDMISVGDCVEIVQPYPFNQGDDVLVTDLSVVFQLDNEAYKIVFELKQATESF